MNRFEMMETCKLTKSDECADISAKTWNKSADILAKLGYMDGVSDGQAASFQTSFDTGYDQGIKFGLQLGFHEALHRLKEFPNNITENLADARKINCSICISRKTEDKIDNLFNVQEERNLELLKRFSTDK